VLHQSGIGVLGPVFRAYDARRDRLVAVKVFRLDIVPEAVVRLADALRRLAAIPSPHPALALPVDVGIEGTTPFLVTDYLAGGTLDVWLRGRGPLAVDAALPVLRALAEAMDAASDAFIRHGALHPRDVFITDDGRLAGVTGFGIVDALTAAGIDHPVMRRPYVAPERAEGSWDGRADVYSLGVLAHEMFTGRRPAGTGDQDGVFAKELAPEQRVHLRRILGQVLQELPARPFRRGQEFVLALEDALYTPGRPPVNRGLTAPDHASAPVDSPAESVDTEPEAPSIVEQPEPFAPEVPEVETPIMAATVLEALPPRPFDAPLEIVIEQPGLPPAAPFVFAPSPASPRGAWGTTLLVAAAGLIVGVLGGALVMRFVSSSPPPAIADAAPVTSSEEARLEPADEDVDDEDGSEVDDGVEAAEPVRRPPAAADARQAIAPRGRLIVRSEPSGALVTMSGRRVGETPLVVSDLPLGTHDVRIARPGHVPRTERVTLGATSPSRTLSVTLQPGLPAVGSSRGAIDVDSRPRGARVLVDGRFVGHAPLRVAELGAGEHQVTLELGGYHSATGRVSVEAGRAQAVRLTLRAIQ
jgi:serine/threonine-protein kinase